MKEQYVLTALANFSCLADKCPLDCCSCFYISVDEAAYHKWQSLADNDHYKAWLLAGVRSKITDGKVERVLCNKPDSPDCIFLSSDRLCLIHAKLGTDFLPAICRDYPRKKMTFPTREISCAFLSCPAILRLVLFDTALPVFNYVAAQEGQAGSVDYLTNEHVVVFLHKLMQQLLPSADYPLSQRLTYLARVMAELISLSLNNELSREALANLEKNHYSNMQGLAMAIESGKFVSNPLDSIYMWDIMRFAAVKHKLFQICGVPEDMPIVQLARKADANGEVKSLFYHELMSLRDRSRQDLQKLDQSFSRYLEGLFMFIPFPFDDKIDPVTPFLTAVFIFAVGQMMLWIKASETGRITEDDIVVILCKVNETMCHHYDIIQNEEQARSVLNLGAHLGWFLEVGSS